MGKILLIMFIFGTLLVSACGSVQNDRNKVIQVEEKKAVASEIRTETLAKLQELKKQSEDTYLHADKNTQIVELRGKEMAQLKSYRLQIEQEAHCLIGRQGVYIYRAKLLDNLIVYKIIKCDKAVINLRFCLIGGTERLCGLFNGGKDFLCSLDNLIGNTRELCYLNTVAIVR